MEDRRETASVDVGNDEEDEEDDEEDDAESAVRNPSSAFRSILCSAALPNMLM